jgi:hypothetical protein
LANPHFQKHPPSSQVYKKKKKTPIKKTRYIITAPNAKRNQCKMLSPFPTNTGYKAQNQIDDDEANLRTPSRSLSLGSKTPSLDFDISVLAESNVVCGIDRERHAYSIAVDFNEALEDDGAAGSVEWRRLGSFAKVLAELGEV